MKTFGTGSKLKRMFITVSYTTVCIAIGFLLATSWETPTRSVAQQSKGLSATGIGNSAQLIDDEGESPFIRIAETVKPVVSLNSYPNLSQIHY